jgi:16S rRNA (uracil1498-N3)-methyltransferase
MSKKSRSSSASKKRSNPISARVFVAGVHAVGDSVNIEGGDARKIVTVLRQRSGDRIEVIDSAAQRFNAALQVEGRFVRATLSEQIAVARAAAKFEITVAQAIPKGQKMDFVVEKLSELGVAQILPFHSERTIPHLTPRNERTERWRRLAKAAAQQSGRVRVPAISPPQDLADVLERCADFDRALFSWELADEEPLRDRLPQLLAGVRSILVVIGPEGGFSAAEAACARERGAHIVSLGAQILRTETAALVLVAILNYLA